MLASIPRFSKSEAYITAASMQLALLWLRLMPGIRWSAVKDLARASTFSTWRSCGVTQDAMNEAYLNPLPQNISSAERSRTGMVVSYELLETVSVIVTWAVAAVISWF